MNPQVLTKLNQRPPGAMVASALDELLGNDAVLLELDANERSIAYRLAMYLQGLQPNRHVDCEYNRDGVDPKKIQHLGLHPNDEDTQARTAFPDIIIHRRNTNENYLVIEIKKSTNTADRAVDFAKLRGYKKNLGFDFALFLELATLDQADVADAEWVDL